MHLQRPRRHVGTIAPNVAQQYLLRHDLPIGVDEPGENLRFLLGERQAPARPSTSSKAPGRKRRAPIAHLAPSSRPPRAAAGADRRSAKGRAMRTARRSGERAPLADEENSGRKIAPGRASAAPLSASSDQNVERAGGEECLRGFYELRVHDREIGMKRELLDQRSAQARRGDDQRFGATATEMNLRRSLLTEHERLGSRRRRSIFPRRAGGVKKNAMSASVSRPPRVRGLRLLRVARRFDGAPSAQGQAHRGDARPSLRDRPRRRHRGAKREGDGATPAGTAAAACAVAAAGPGRRPAPFRRVSSGRTISGATIRRPSPIIIGLRAPTKLGHERLWRDDRLYDVVGVLDYNIRPRELGRGSAIFFHIATPRTRPDRRLRRAARARHGAAAAAALARRGGWRSISPSNSRARP